MGRFRNVTKERPCPICAKPDWCGWKLFDSGDEVLVCQRDETRVNTCGLDGKFYIYVKQSEDGNSMFEEVNQRIKNQNAWREAHGYKKKDEFSSSFQNASYQKAQTRERQMTILDNVCVKPHKELDKIYRSILGDLILEDNHREYLLKEGWSEELIEKYLIRSFPEKDYSRCQYKNFFSKSLYRKRLAAKQIERFGENALLGVPGAYKDRGGNWTFAGQKGILFPLPDANGLFFGLRTRLDFMDVNAELIHVAGGDSYYVDTHGVQHYLVPLKGTYTIQGGEKVWDKSGGKYRPFQSYHLDEKEYEKGFIKNSYDSGCAVEDQVGIYFDPQRDYHDTCYITEGEKKGIFANYILRTPIVSLPGVNSWSKLLKGKKGERIVDRLKAYGVRVFIIAYDADKSVNEKVMAQQNRVVEALRAEGFFIGTAEWDMELGKGLDDLLAGGHKPGYQLA